MLEPGVTFGGAYRLEQQLGEGGMGVVWLATHLLLQEPRAIKIIRGEFASTPHYRQGFIQNEARNALRLGHYDHIVRIFELGLNDDTPFLVMEYVRGGPFGADLAKLLKARGRLSLPEINQMLEQIAAALEVAHRQNLAHLDLKPNNILVDTGPAGEPYLKLSDFGLTTDLTAPKQAAIPGSGYGTPAYMSPEQWAGRAGISSDLYALGVILYQLLTGHLPFTGNLDSLREQHFKLMPPPPWQFDPALPLSVSEVVLKALAKQPGERFSSAREMAQAFQLALQNNSSAGFGASLDMSLGLRSISLPQIALPSPYRGLFAFREEDLPFFFGREVFTDRLVEVVPRQPLTALIGPSGSGKSSVVYAGLIPRLRAIGSWLLLPLRPGDRPLHSLARVLVPFLQPDMPEIERLVEINKLAELFSRKEISLVQILAHLRETNAVSGVLLFVDQFEELYTLCLDNRERERFIEEIMALVNQRKAGNGLFLANLLITLRADFLGYTLTYRPLADALQYNDLKLGPLNRAELRAVVEEPAKLLGVYIEKGLADRIVEAVSERPGDLPLLEFTLALLWGKQTNGTLTHAAYDDLGGVEGALVRYADEVFTRFNPDEKEIVRQIFLQLVKPGEGTEDTRRVATRQELGETSWQVVNRLVESRLLVSSRDEATAQEMVEVVHETLISRWERLREWLRVDRDFRTWQERVRAALLQWDISKKDDGTLLRGLPLVEAREYLKTHAALIGKTEQEFIQASILRDERERSSRRRARRLLTAGLAIGLVVTLALSIVAVFQWQQSENQRIVAVNAQNEANSQRDTAIQSRLEANNQRDTALKAQQDADNQRQQAEAQKQRAEAQTRLALSRQLSAQARNRFTDRFDLGLLLSLEAIRVNDSAETRGSLLSGLLSHPDIFAYLRGHSDYITGLAFSPDGKLIASSSWDKTIRLWDAATGKPSGQPFIGHTDYVTSVAFSPDGKTLASSSNNYEIFLWDVATGKRTGQFGAGSDYAVCITFSPDGKTLISGNVSGAVKLWDITSLKQSGELRGHTDAVYSVAISPDGKTIASGSQDNTVILWDNQTQKAIGQPLNGHTNLVNGVAFSPDGKILASASNDKSIILWDVVSHQPIGQPLVGHTDAVWAVAFSPDGKTLASGSYDRNVILWNVQSHQPIGLPLSGHSDYVYAVAFSPDGKTLATGGRDNTIILRKTNSENRLGEKLLEHTDNVRSVAFSPDGTILASGSSDSTIILWDLATKKPIAKLNGHTNAVSKVAFSPDGKTLISSSYDKTLILWDVGTGQAIGQPFKGHVDNIWSVAFSPDGKTIASAGADKTIILWDVATHQPIGQPWIGHSGFITSVAFSPDGKTLASGAADKTIMLWNVATHQPIGQPLKGHSDYVIAVAFSPDGTVLASGSSDSTIILWDLAKQKPLATLKGHSSVVRNLTFSPDGKTLASASYDKTVILWDIASREQIGQPLAGHTSEVYGVAFSPDGKILATSGLDKAIILWDLDLSFLKGKACELAGRSLTEGEWSQFLGEEPYSKTCPNQ